MKKLTLILAAVCMTFFISGCSPKVGSPEWCKAMKQKPRGQWTTDEMGEFAKNCLFK